MGRSNDNWKFEGFSSPNFTTIPDEFFDWVSPRLTGAEVKVMNYIMRRTFGFKKQCDNISISQMLGGIVKKNGKRLDLGAGLAKSTLTDALNSLEKKGVIIRKQQWDIKNGGCVASNYQLHFRSMTPGSKTGQGMSEISTRPLVQKPDTQYTVNNKQVDNNVNVANKTRKQSPLHKLEDLEKENDHIKLIAADILEALGDNQSKQFYLLVARKIPEFYIRETLSELKQSTVRSKARVFTRKMLDFVDYALNKKLKQEFGDFKSRRVEIAQRFRSHQ